MGKRPSAITGVDLIRAHRGMAGALAAHLGITASAVSRWGMIPAERVGAVADYTGWPKHRLRPDLWPPRGRPPKVKRKAKATNGHAK
jgi:DNA-binding transcriptional regulator YdaS (Cro superfamily)